MAGKQDDSHRQGKEKTRPPSTGRGAASALDALIKRRVPPPPQSPPPQAPKKH
jgi:hypothetical protein